jgi:hypothetical protein
MNNRIERRRSARIPFLLEEAAVIHAGDRELPARLVDLSYIGALVTLLDMPALGSRDFIPDERLELSMHHNDSVFHIMARVVRTGPLFVAVEFVDEKTDVIDKLRAKINAPLQAKSAQQSKS